MKKIIITLLTICPGVCTSLFAQTIPLKGGSISQHQTIILGETPATLTSSVAASGGSAPIAYAWESSIDNSKWIPISGASSASYNPRSLTKNTFFRRKATAGTQTAYSNTVTISVIYVTNNVNYILTQTYTAENDSLCVADINYYDGLGYPSQSVHIGASPEMKSIVSPVYYDAMRRENRQYLPYAVTDGYGIYRPAALSNQVKYYNDNYGNNAGGHSYTENVYEASPLNRVKASYNVGNVFRSDEKKSTFDYETNAETEVMRFKVNSQVLETEGFYNANTLFKNTVTNEDGSSAVTYNDFQDRVILERVVECTDNSTMYDTYYVYDNIGNLCYVLPPKLSEAAASGPVSDTEIDELAYVYRYDGHNRCFEKRLPGADPVYMVYDKGDRLVMSQDGNMRDRNQWAYTEYDGLGRPVCQSILVSPGTITPSILQSRFDTAPVTKAYNPLDSGFSEDIVLTKTVYDAYISEDETEIITLDQIPVGTNIRGWTFRVTQTDSSIFWPVGAVRSIYLNGDKWISLIHDSGDNVIIEFDYCMNATEEILWGLYDGGWSIREGHTFTLKDDQDYIVTGNNLPISNETIWGFDQIIAVKPASAH